MIKQFLAMAAMLGLLITAPAALAAQSGEQSPSWSGMHALNVKAELGISGDHDSSFPMPTQGALD